MEYLAGLWAGHVMYLVSIRIKNPSVADLALLMSTSARISLLCRCGLDGEAY